MKQEKLLTQNEIDELKQLKIDKLNWKLFIK